MVLSETTEIDVKGIITGLRSDCTRGRNNFPTSIIKSTYDVMVPIITYICKLSISSGVFPDVFKKALVLPVYKGGHPTISTITILSTMSKMFERVLSRSLISYLESRKIIANYRFGFRANLSTEDAIYGFDSICD